MSAIPLSKVMDLEGFPLAPREFRTEQARSQLFDIDGQPDLEVGSNFPCTGELKITLLTRSSENFSLLFHGIKYIILAKGQ